MKDLFLSDRQSIPPSQPFTENELYEPMPEQEYRVIPNMGDKNLNIHVPVLSSEVLKCKIEALRRFHREVMVHKRLSEIVDALDQIVEHWVNPNSKWRILSAKLLPMITGYDQGMTDTYLTRFFKGFRKEKLLRFIDEDFGNPLVLDEFRPRSTGGYTKAYGPEIITHVFSGNVPGLPVWSLICGFLVKSTHLGKVSSSEPLLPYLFAQSIREIVPWLGPALDIVSWKGGEDEIEKVAFSQVDAVIAYGSDRTIAEVRRKTPAHVRLLLHGHKVSFAAIGKEALDPHRIWDTAHRVAHDISLFDQQGCVAPHTVFVEKDADVSPQVFCGMLARELDNFQRKWPRSSLTIGESTTLQSIRASYEMRMGMEDHIQVHTAYESTAWTVIYQEQEPFPISPLNRFAFVIPVDDVMDISHRLSSVRHHVQTAGVALSPLRLRLFAEAIGRVGVNRVCSIGHMSYPDPGWHHDGRWSLLDLVRWTDIEAPTEGEMEKYDPYRN
jgi:hypothetical protein